MSCLSGMEPELVISAGLSNRFILRPVIFHREVRTSVSLGNILKEDTEPSIILIISKSGK